MKVKTNELENINKQIKTLKKKRKALVLEVNKPLNTGFGIICGNSDSASLSLLAGYAVKIASLEDLKYYAIDDKVSFLPNLIAVDCVVAIDKRTYELIVAKNAVIEQFLRNNFPEDFNWE
jgi:hypothetical protein